MGPAPIDGAPHVRVRQCCPSDAHPCRCCHCVYCSALRCPPNAPPLAPLQSSLLLMLRLTLCIAPLLWAPLFFQPHPSAAAVAMAGADVPPPPTFTAAVTAGLRRPRNALPPSPPVPASAAVETDMLHLALPLRALLRLQYPALLLMWWP